MNKKSRLAGHAAAAPLSPAALKRRHRKNRIYLVCLILAAVVLVAAAVILRIVSEHQAYNDYIEQAQAYYYKSDYDSALAALRKAAALEENDECGMLMAACYEAQGNYAKALEVLRQMDTKNPTIASRISSIEAYRKTLSEAEKISVAGRQFSLSTSSLVLDGLGLNSSVLDEVAQLYSLDSLSLADNAIENIGSISKLGGLVTLNLSNNIIRDISALTSLTSLRTLYLDNNPIYDLSPLYSLSNLTSLSIKGISITESQLRNLSKALPNCAIHSEAAKEEVQDISFAGMTFKSDITELDLSNMGLRDISGVSGCEKLTKINLSGNQISDLSPLMNLPHLRQLDISNTQVSDLRPLMGLETLSILNASGCHISSTSALSMMEGLTELYLDNNSIGDFSGLRKLKNLGVLSLRGTGLNDEGLYYLRSLGSLYSLNIEENSQISGEAVDELRMYLNSCIISHSELAYTVDFDGHSVASDSVNLALGSCAITDISAVTSLKKLQGLDLHANYISNLYPLEQADCRYNIVYLDLSQNMISDVTPIASLLNIESLDLSYNSINSELPFMRLSKLEQLVLTGNPLTEEQIQRLRTALPGCEIIF